MTYRRNSTADSGVFGHWWQELRACRKLFYTIGILVLVHLHLVIIRIGNKLMRLLFVSYYMDYSNFCLALNEVILSPPIIEN